jgi:hypothetical protein
LQSRYSSLRKNNAPPEGTPPPGIGDVQSQRGSIFSPAIV